VVEIEAAHPADACALLLLRRRILQEGQWFITEPDEEKTGLSGWVERLCSPDSTTHIARSGLLVLGYITVDRSILRRNRHVGRLHLSVAAEARGQGLGKRLMEAAMAAAWSVGIEKLSLAVFAENQRAIALYKSCGFVEEGRRKGEFRVGGRAVDDLLMARWVSCTTE
jgi:ribosomal protein S18 acetylase RimI-like enzyme